MPVVVFRSRLRPETAEEFRKLLPHMLELARSIPGFVSYKAFEADDGERVSIIEFETDELFVRGASIPSTLRRRWRDGIGSTPNTTSRFASRCESASFVPTRPVRSARRRA